MSLLKTFLLVASQPRGLIRRGQAVGEAPANPAPWPSSTPRLNKDRENARKAHRKATGQSR